MLGIGCGMDIEVMKGNKIFDEKKRGFHVHRGDTFASLMCRRHTNQTLNQTLIPAIRIFQIVQKQYKRTYMQLVRVVTMLYAHPCCIGLSA